MKLTYDQAKPEEIEKFSQLIVGKTLRDFMSEEDFKDLKQNRGSFGTAIEKYFFGIEPGGYQGPDFKEAKVELKTTGIKKVQNEWKAKERLVLGMIDFEKVISEEFESSSMLAKSSLLLIMFYIYKKTKCELDFIDYVIKLSRLFKFSNEDLVIIKQDWEKIVKKIRDGKAHELSEGDTFYLGACTKGKDSLDKRKQPNSDILAMRRAFSIKQNYLNVILSRSLDAEPVLKQSEILKNKPIEELFLNKFEQYKNKSVKEIAKLIGMEDINSKSYYHLLTMRMLGVKTQKALELEKAEICLKTIRLNKNGTPKEAMSFPAFKYKEIVEQDWESSDFKSELEKKFLFIVFQYNDEDELIFKNALFWNMPYSDLVQAKEVWEETVKRIRLGMAENLPKSSETYNVHVRPHAQNSNDTYETPQGQKLVKKCFWLNTKYLAEILS